MDSPGNRPFVADTDGLRVSLQLEWRIASLRYFDPAGVFASAARDALGGALPGPLRAVSIEGTVRTSHRIMTWRSPTETWLLTQNPAEFADLERRLSSEVDGCMVDQTGGIRVLSALGPRAADLLVRLGATTAIPAVGEARTGRLAELTVLAACVQAGEFLLLVDRVYADHLIEWIRATASDFASAGQPAK